MTDTPLAIPNAELVTIAWLRRAGWTADVATTLPRRDAWTGDLFLQVRAIAGSGSNIGVAERRTSVLALDAWAATLNAPRPKWRTAADGLEHVRTMTFAAGDPRPLPMPSPAYQRARVLSAYLASEPARIENDPSGYARMTCTLAVDWTV